MSDNTLADRVLAYENLPVMRPLVEALLREAKSGELVIYRGPFRWKYSVADRDMRDWPVICNGYEMFDLPQIASDNGWDVRYDFCHAAIVHPKVLEAPHER